MNRRWHGNKSDKQLESYLRSANRNDIGYTFAVMEKQKRVEQRIWTRK